MSAWASLERFGENDLVFIKWRLCRNCFKNEWTLAQEQKEVKLSLSYLSFKSGFWFLYSVERMKGGFKSEDTEEFLRLQHK